MDNSGVTQTPEEVGMVCSDSAYGSSVVDTDTEDGQTPTSNTFPYNEDLTHKVMTFTLLLTSNPLLGLASPLLSVNHII